MRAGAAARRFLRFSRTPQNQAGADIEIKGMPRNSAFCRILSYSQGLFVPELPNFCALRAQPVRTLAAAFRTHAKPSGSQI